MAKSLGSSLPPQLMTLLDGTKLVSTLGQALVLATIDPDGHPHFAMLSYSELIATDPNTLRFALWTKGATAGNLRANGEASFCLTTAGEAYYFKTAVRELAPAVPGYPGQAPFEARVLAVSLDRDPETAIVTGITFAPRGSPEQEIERGLRLLAAVRSLP